MAYEEKDRHSRRTFWCAGSSLSECMLPHPLFWDRNVLSVHPCDLSTGDRAGNIVPTYEPIPHAAFSSSGEEKNRFD
jgi:hypothetical protein